MRKCLSHCRRYNKNKFFKTAWHRYFHNHHVLEQRTHDQNVVTKKLSGQIRMRHDTWKSITSCISNTWKSPDFFANWLLITNIILNDAQVLLGCQHISVLGFDKHFHAWSIELEEKFFIHPAKFKSLEQSVLIKDRRKLFVNYDWIQ